MGATVELRQISEAAAATYMREPAYLIQEERDRHEEFSKHYHVDFDFDEWDKARKQRGYDWVVLVKGIVSFSKVAHSLVVSDAQPIGGLEESWEMEGNASVLTAKQVSILYNELAPIVLSPDDEHFDGHALMLQDFQSFLQEAVDTGKALLIFQAP
jgi:hypothetical protein